MQLLALPLAHPDALVGRRVSRHFPGYGRFEGGVVGCDDGGTRGYKLRYEDGDEESEIPTAEVLRLLLPTAKGGKAKSAKRRRGEPQQCKE